MSEDFIDVERIHLARAIHIARTVAGFNSLQLAKEAGISAAMVSELQTGTRSPSMEVLTDIASACEIRVSCLLSIAESLAARRVLHDVPDEFHRAIQREVRDRRPEVAA